MFEKRTGDIKPNATVKKNNSGGKVITASNINCQDTFLIFRKRC